MRCRALANAILAGYADVTLIKGMLMRATISALVCVGFLACNPGSPAKSGDSGTATVAAAKDPNVEKSLTDLENAWPKAVADRDAATFERILAPNFVYTEDSVLYKRDEVIKGMTSGTDSVQSGNNEDMKVHDFGNGTAVVTGILVLVGRNPTGPFTHRYRFTDTWMYRDGKWQIVAAQDYLIPRYK
jgi:hypothetical protein